MEETNNNIAHFGDGEMAFVYRYAEYVDEENGVSYCRFLLRPSTVMCEKFMFPDLDESGFLERSYPFTQVLEVKKELHCNRWWIFTDVEGGKAKPSEYWDACTSVIEDQERYMNSLRSSKDYALYELDQERTRSQESIKIQSNLIKTVAEARGRTDDGEGGGDYDDSQ